MLTAFYLSGAVALVATVMVIRSPNAMHALLYLVVSLLAVAVVFYVLGAPFIAALEVIVYAGAVVVLFIFAVMLLNLGQATVNQERSWLRPLTWFGPVTLGGLLLLELVYLVWGRPETMSGRPVLARDLSVTLFGTYLIGVELASLLLLAGLVAAYHLGHSGRREGK